MKTQILLSMVREFKANKPQLFRKLVIGASILGVVGVLFLGVAGYFLFQAAGFLLNQAATLTSGVTQTPDLTALAAQVPTEVSAGCWDYLSRLVQLGTWLEVPLAEIGTGFQKSCLQAQPPGPV